MIKPLSHLFVPVHAGGFFLYPPEVHASRRRQEKSLEQTIRAMRRCRFHVAVAPHRRRTSSRKAHNPSTTVTSPILGFSKKGIGETGRDLNLGGWLVLNGAAFKNADYPDLATALAEADAERGYKSPEPDYTDLPNEPHEAKPSGEVVRGFAICPSKALCEDHVGAFSRSIWMRQGGRARRRELAGKSDACWPDASPAVTLTSDVRSTLRPPLGN